MQVTTSADWSAIFILSELPWTYTVLSSPALLLATESMSDEMSSSVNFALGNLAMAMIAMFPVPAPTSTQYLTSTPECTATSNASDNRAS